MKSVTKILTYIISACAAMSVQAQTLSLDSVLHAIRDNHPTMAQYEQRLQAAEAYTRGATAWMAPMLGAGTFMTPYPAQRDAEMSGKGSLMFSAEQQIPNPSRLKARKDFYHARTGMEAAGQGVAYNELRAAAKTAYYRWVVLEKKAEVLRQNKRLMQTMKKVADIRYPYGQGSLGSIYQAEARLEEVDNMLLMTETAITQQNIMLNTLMNVPVDTKYRIDTTAGFTPLLATADTSSLFGQRSDLRQLDKTIERMRLNTRLMALEARPDFSIRFDHMSAWDGMMPGQFTLMGMISIPVAPWSSRGYKAEIAGMQYEIAAMEKEKQAMRNDLQGMLASLFADISSLQQQLENYRKKIIPAFTRNYQTLMLAYEENTEELPMVIDAWEALNMAQLQYLEQLEKYYLMQTDYEKILEK